MTYDTDKVDALLKAVDELNKNKLGFTGFIVDEVIQAAQALKPQPEMEYVLPVWDEFSSKGEVSITKGGSTKVTINNIDTFYRANYESLREATRRPKQDKVPLGSEWSDADLNELFKAYALSSHTAVFPSGVRAVIDAIKSKCGV